MTDSTELEAALGRMVYWAAALEMSMRFVGEMLAPTGDEKDALADTKMTGRVLSAVVGIASDRSEITPKELDELKEIVKDARSSLEIRNDYIHGAWGEVDGVLLAMNRRPGTFRTRPLAVADLEALATELQGLVNRTTDWSLAVFRKTHPQVFR
ncbi:hypothetical protein [Actinacidiphila oryziradicis]|uniref:Uncharacterized protein n=1 Tax=Actinacidiphila oryziradicis TaxID=2571141 RepID=A0A4U0RMN5_9ACTN|nr:hypothetical protein [Actinacidiphila oryziradicis]TJZ97129.1 hypothetical protein FCI23_49885 [Actinacidiphila oryziradicis]